MERIREKLARLDERQSPDLEGFEPHVLRARARAKEAAAEHQRQKDELRYWRGVLTTSRGKRRAEAMQQVYLIEKALREAGEEDVAV